MVVKLNNGQILVVKNEGAEGLAGHGGQEAVAKSWSNYGGQIK
jgi:hypothetical protein